MSEERLRILLELGFEFGEEANITEEWELRFDLLMELLFMRVSPLLCPWRSGHSCMVHSALQRTIQTALCSYHKEDAESALLLHHCRLVPEQHYNKLSSKETAASNACCFCAAAVPDLLVCVLCRRRSWPMATLMQRLPGTGCAWSGALWAARLPGRLLCGCSCSASSSVGTCSPWSLPSAWKPWALSGNPRYANKSSVSHLGSLSMGQAFLS